MTEADVEALRNTVMRTLGSSRAAADADAFACFFVPGRIEVLGKHTDYAGGRSLLAAVDRGFVIAAAARPDNVVRVMDAASTAHVELDAAGDATGTTPAWATYPQTVVRRCASNFPAAAGGADIVFASNLPQAAGLSSSSAFIVATFLALDAVRRLSRTMEYRRNISGTADLAAYLGAVENGITFRDLAGDRGVGTMGGSQDHTAILCAEEGRLVQYAFLPVRLEAGVDMPAGWTFAVAATGVRAEKTGAVMEDYNRLSGSVRRLVELWHHAGAGDEPALADILGTEPDASLRLRDIVRQHAPQEAGLLLPRLAQFIAESDDLVPSARAALARGDIAGLSHVVRRSMELAVHALHNQTRETIHLTRSAHTLGAAAASAFGAGFGGSVWALVREEHAVGYLDAWRSEYEERYPEHAGSSTFFITPAAGPAQPLSR